MRALHTLRTSDEPPPPERYREAQPGRKRIRLKSTPEEDIAILDEIIRLDQELFVAKVGANNVIQNSRSYTGHGLGRASVWSRDRQTLKNNAIRHFSAPKVENGQKLDSGNVDSTRLAVGGRPGRVGPMNVTRWQGWRYAVT